MIHEIKEGDIITFPSFNKIKVGRFSSGYQLVIYCIEADVNGKTQWVSLPSLFRGVTQIGICPKDYYELVYILSDTTLIVIEDMFSISYRRMKANREEEKQRKIRTSTLRMNVALHLFTITHKEYAALDKQALEEDVWNDRILIKIPKAGTIPDIDYYAFQCFMADFLNIKIWRLEIFY